MTDNSRPLADSALSPLSTQTSPSNVSTKEAAIQAMDSLGQKRTFISVDENCFDSVRIILKGCMHGKTQKDVGSRHGQRVF